MTFEWVIRRAGPRIDEFARVSVKGSSSILLHDPPNSIDVDVYRVDGTLLARSEGLSDYVDHEWAKLRISDGQVRRENIPPSDDDIRSPVVMRGSVVGTLEPARDEDSLLWRVEPSVHP